MYNAWYMYGAWCRYGVCMSGLWCVHGVYCMGELRLSQCTVMGEQGYGGARLWGSKIMGE